MDISELSLKELENLQEKIAAEIKKGAQRRKAAVIEQLRRLAQENGFTLEALIGGDTPRRARKPVAVKYRHPTNGALSWTGRGRTPKWVNDWQAAHGSRDGLLVK